MTSSRAVRLGPVVLAVILAASAAFGRSWTISGSRGHYRYTGDLTSVSTDGKTIYLRNTKGQTVKLSLSSVSSSDRQYVQQWSAARRPAPTPASTPSNPAPAPPVTPPPVTPPPVTQPPVTQPPVTQPRSGGSDSGAAAGDLLTDTQPSRRLALLIGVGDYTDLAKLKLAVPDIVALRERLVGTGFAAGDIVCMTTEETSSELRPTRQRLGRQLDPEASDSFMTGIRKGDFVLIAMSGHGVEIDGTPYFCPSDADASDAKTMISIDAMYENLEKSPAQFKVVLIDACRETISLSSGRSAATTARNSFARSIDISSEDSGVMVMQSCSSGEISWENANLGHGVFMYHLMQGLSGEADKVKTGNQDGIVQLMELYKFTAESTKNYTRNLPGAELQTPILRGEFTDFDFTEAIVNVKLVRFTVRIDTPNGPPGIGLPIVVARRDAFKPGEEPETLVTGRTDPIGEIEMRIPMDRVGKTDHLIARIAYKDGIVNQKLEDIQTLPHQILIASATAAHTPVPPPTPPPAVVVPRTTPTYVRPQPRSMRLSELTPAEQGHLKSLAGILVRKAKDYERKHEKAGGKGALARGAADAAKRAALTAESNLQKAIDKIESKYGRRVDIGSILR